MSYAANLRPISSVKFVLLLNAAASSVELASVGTNSSEIVKISLYI